MVFVTYTGYKKKSCNVVLGFSRYSVPEKFFTDEAYSDGVMRVNFLNWREKYW